MTHRRSSHSQPSGVPSRRAVKRRRVVRRIPLKSLEALSPADVRLGNELLSLLPTPEPGQRLLRGLADETGRLIGPSHDIFFHTMRTYAGSEFTTRLDDLFVTTLRLAPDPGELVLAADMALAADWLEALLEDEPPAAHALPPPSPRDFGLVTFVLSQLVHWLTSRGLPPLSLPSAAPNHEALAQRLRRQTSMAELVYVVTSGRGAGLVRFFIPADMVRKMKIFVSAAARHDRRKHRMMKSRLGRLTTRLTVTLGAVPLHVAELANLGSQDVLLPAEHGLRTDRLARPEGHGRLWLDDAHQTYLACELRRRTDSRWEVNVIDARPVTANDCPPQATRLAQEIDMSDEQPAEPDQAAETGTTATHILERADVDVEIRLGAITLPVSMLAELQSGYVLEMDRRVEDGVDLVVDGREVGSGELVNVDGRLGVRVLSIRN